MDTYNYWVSTLQRSGRELKNLDFKLQKYSLCLYAVENDGFALFYVNPKYQDYQMCLAAIYQNGYAVMSVPNEILDKHPELLKFAEKQIQFITGVALYRAILLQPCGISLNH